MENRDVSISVCGIVVGIMIGAALLHLQDAVTASTFGVPTRPQAALENYRRDNRATLHPAAGSDRVAPVVTTTSQADATTLAAPCAAVGDFYRQLTSTLEAALPTTDATSFDARKFDASKALILATMKSVLTKYCGTASDASVATQTSTVTVENRCNQYSGARKVTCLGFQTRGITYDGN
ncbi:hypothetical protein HY285_01875 [Candidatus Peregrinibacteria bacterium]|nr:hypothetical protein [Candidatus Peregrinibacteria bacterium]MBI3816275.1 hypothetical protein [Candidatus Peregrinibacteria bacterium]